MLSLIVEVKPLAIQVYESSAPLRTVHARAVIDGQAVLYSVKRCKTAREYNKHWFERGLNHCYYDAQQRGTHVRFERVEYLLPEKAKVSEDQLTLFGGVLS